MSRRASGLIVALGALLGGCAHETAADRAPRPDPVARLAPVGDAPWREDLGDPVLHELLRRADLGALDIKVALARLERAQAEADIAAAGRQPQAVLGAAGAVGARNFSSQRSAGGPTFEATYELDLSGRLARLAQAAVSERQAAADEVAGARLLVAAETAQAYVALCAAKDTAAAGARRQASAERALALGRARQAEGAATAQDVEVYAAATQAAAANEQTARVSAALAAIRLRILVGGGELPAPLNCALPDRAPSTDPLPASLVDRRPEVAAAFARLRAADLRRAAAVAAERPQFQITAVLGAPDAAIATLLDTRGLAWALAGRIAETVFDGGAGRGRIRSATAEADLADLAYRKAVLQGWSELQTATLEAHAAADRLATARQEVRRAEAAIDTVRVRHLEGAADGLAVAAAEGRIEDARNALSQARAGAANARIQMSLAGGGQ